jgi:hypothetical protein
MPGIRRICGGFGVAGRMSACRAAMIRGWRAGGLAGWRAGGLAGWRASAGLLLDQLGRVFTHRHLDWVQISTIGSANTCSCSIETRSDSARSTEA